MKIVYITTAIDSNDYKSFTKLWIKSPNPSNQNFHNKLIRSISLTNEIHVISIRPFSKKLCKTRKLKAEPAKTDGNITWHYLAISGDKLSRLISVKRQAKSIFKHIYKKDEDIVIFTDTINPMCINVANSLSKKYQIPTIGICTDSPSNITGTTKTYTTYLLKQASKCYAYLALTQELNDLFNPSNKPSLIVEGLVEPHTPSVNAIGISDPYFFFAGALLERYGVYNLIEAFGMLKTTKVDLYICGHSGNEEKLKEAIKDNPLIHYLGTLPVSIVLDYECAALANINPRPYSEDLDRFSIPSKTIEYLSSGRPTISVKNTKLMKHFKENAIWARSSEPEDLCQAMRTVINLTKEERKTLGSEAKEKANALYSLKSINRRIHSFLELFKTRVN